MKEMEVARAAELAMADDEQGVLAVNGSRCGEVIDGVIVVLCPRMAS